MVLAANICERALEARDARFDGLFFVGITSTGIYCRPICPARVSYSSHRRFFDSAAAAECAGFRPCLRCRPELAPGRALCDAVPRLARVAAGRIASGALNGRNVSQLADELGVSERHLRRALEREIGVPPVELAQTCRLLLAKQLLRDTSLSVTRIAYASGFQSLRRFNASFRSKYALNPSTVRRARRTSEGGRGGGAATVSPASELIHLTLAYRAPMAWDILMSELQREAIPEVAWVDGSRYGRTICIDGCRGLVLAEDAQAGGRASPDPRRMHLNVSLSPALLPVLMPLLARLRQLFDLDAEPVVVDSHLKQAGLGALVRRRPGLRIPGTIDAFEVIIRAMLGASNHLMARIVRDLGEPLATGIPALARLAPTAERIADAGPARLRALDIPPRRVDAVGAVSRAIADGTVDVRIGGDIDTMRRLLIELGGMDDRLATMTVMRTHHWPDAFPEADRVLQRAAGASSARELRARAEQWRPWRAYAAQHLWLHAQHPPA
jgi:AraC family transcriptional regulator of adaptative response / DNA-3-methyladenine glycosylase II